MPKRVAIREVSAQERSELERLKRSRTAAQRQVERARIILGVLEGKRIDGIAAEVGRSPATIYNQIHQFNQRGLGFLNDVPRAGRPETYDQTQRGQLVLTAKTKPEQLGLPFGHWTLDRLVTYVNTSLHIAISRSQLAAVLQQEGLKWYQEKTYFTQSPDPQFVEKRGRL